MRSGGEKWLEDALALLWRNAATAIADGEFQPLAAAQFRTPPDHQAAGKRQHATLRHGLDGIGEEIEQYLLHLGNIRLHGGNVTIEALHRDSGVGALPLHDIQDMVTQYAELDRNQMQLARTGEEQ